MSDLRMRDVMKRTGLSRQAVHFYVEQGLVDPPAKTGQTVGHYTEAHVERILLVKQLQEEHFLPLRAIRAMLDGTASGFTRTQQQVLRQVKARLPDQTTADRGLVPLAPLLARTKLARREVDELARHGLVRIVRGRPVTIAAEHVWLVELWAEVRAAGFTRELGVDAELLVLFERGVAQIFDDEKRVLSRMAATLTPARVAELVERALPLMHEFLVRSHQAKVRALFATVDAEAAS